MALGGRPKEGPGHRAFNMSVQLDIYEMLKKVPNRSRFIEETIRPVLNQLDPGPSCNFLRKVDEMAKDELLKATLNKDFEKITAIGTMMTKLQDYRVLCNTLPDEKSCEDRGGRWENGVCRLPDTFQKRKVYPK